MVVSRRRRSDAPMTFQGKPVAPDLLQQLWANATQGLGASWRQTRYRMAVARGLRLKTRTIELPSTWARRHPEAAEWVVKVLPERRTLERDLIAAVGSAEPSYSRVPVPSGAGGGLLARDADYAEACENYLETWRKTSVPTQTFFEKGTEDGPYAVVVLPADVDMEGCPDFYDRLSEAAHAAIADEDERAAYTRDEDDPKGRYSKKDAEGRRRPNPAYDRDKDGRPRRSGDAAFARDDEQSREAHREAVRRYLLKQEQGAVTVRVVPANDCVPYLVRGTKRERWKLFALIERTLYYPEELLVKGYGWRGMGDHLLVPQGFDPTRQSGQDGQFYVYTLYRTWVDPNDPKKVERPIIAYSVGGFPTWSGEAPPADRELPDNGLAVIDLYETHGLEGPFWWFGGGLHTADDNPDYYWEPYLWPLAETIAGLEGMQTMANAATAVNATTGYFHRPDPKLLEIDGESLVETNGDLRRPAMPAPGEIETAIGEVFPATPASVSPDLWRVIATEYDSLRVNTALEQAGAGAGATSGHAMVVKETIAQTAKRHIREGAADAVRFCGERALMIFCAIARTHDVRWPIQTTRERPVGTEIADVSDVLEFDPAWVGEHGEYGLNVAYPEEYNAVRVEQAMNKIAAGVGSFEELAEASGKTDVATELSKVMQTQIWLSEPYREMMLTRLAKRKGDKVMLQVLRLQQQARMTRAGPPGFETGLPTAALNGPSTPERSLGGQMAAAVGPPQQDAAAVAQLTPQQQGAA